MKHGDYLMNHDNGLLSAGWQLAITNKPGNLLSEICYSMQIRKDASTSIPKSLTQMIGMVYVLMMTRTNTRFFYKTL